MPPPGAAARAALALIRAYKLVLSPWFTGACRFVPTCADYSAEAIARHGLLRGAWLGARRLSRCHPLGSHGHDPVPPSVQRRRPGFRPSTGAAMSRQSGATHPDES